MITNRESLIVALSKEGESVFGRRFKLVQYESGEYGQITYHNNGEYPAINRLDHNENEMVKVSEWFNDYYVYVKVKFVLKGMVGRKARKNKSELRQCSIWISVFKNVSGDITQLFRVEWDDYDGADKYSHPQPHWHITLNRIQASKFEESLSEGEADGFNGLLSNQEKHIPLSLEKFHFAMGGNWEDKHQGCVSMTTNEQIAHWFEWILSSIRKELEYIN